MMSGQIVEKDLNEGSPTTQGRKFLIYSFVPVFLIIGCALAVAYYFYPYTDSSGALDEVAQGIKNTFGDWFKLWLGAFIGFVSAIVTYYFSKENQNS